MIVQPLQALEEVQMWGFIDVLAECPIESLKRVELRGVCADMDKLKKFAPNAVCKVEQFVPITNATVRWEMQIIQ